MIWVIVDRLCQTLFLVLAMTLLILLFNNTYRDRVVVDGTLSALELYKQENAKMSMENVSKLESKINSIESNQDSYQLSTSRRIDKLEQKVASDVDRLNKRINNQNTKLNYWIDKNKEKQLGDKLKRQE